MTLLEIAKQCDLTMADYRERIRYVSNLEESSQDYGEKELLRIRYNDLRYLYDNLRFARNECLRYYGYRSMKEVENAKKQKDWEASDKEQRVSGLDIKGRRNKHISITNYVVNPSTSDRRTSYSETAENIATLFRNQKDKSSG